MRSCGLLVERCKVMDSFTSPLWLEFGNRDPGGEPLRAIFKAGDDLRQDALTLQMVRVMERLWRQRGLDLRLTPYACVPTGDAMGLIEVVPESTTIARIHKRSGGAAAALLSTTALLEWLKEHNATEAALASAVDNFKRSLAGYCVATYALGLADRHNDNIMVTKSGHLFHIDFGHFLGNYLKFAGIKRENAPFVLTPEFAYVFGGKKSPDFQTFIGLCTRAFNVVRANAHVFIYLFTMMLSTGIPQLQKDEDIDYLRKALVLDLTDDAAATFFTQLIYDSLANKRTALNFFAHSLAH